MNTENEDKAFYEPKLMYATIEDIVEEVLQDHIKKTQEENTELNVTLVKERIRIRVAKVFNEHAKAQAMLNSKERESIKVIEKRIERIDWEMGNRDPEETQRLIQKFGSRYIDYKAIEKTALEWVLKFVHEHSV